MTLLPEQDKDFEKLVIGFRLILEGLGCDLAAPHFIDTPRRAAKAWYNELCGGLTQPGPKITSFPSATDEMVILNHIPIRSVCAHHLLPFIGEASIGYIPARGKILGLSKLSRIADYWARRPQVQEDLTQQIANDVAETIGLFYDKEEDVNKPFEKKGGVGVVIRARHMCMELRGVMHGGEMVTSAMLGVFLDKPEARAEFLKLVEP